MSNDTAYAPVSLIYKSRGLTARNIYDQCGEFTYIDFLNCLEREENSLSSRYGTTIITRDAVGSGTSNHFFNQPITSLSRLNYQSSTWRYAGLGDGSLWRRTGDSQGAYTQLTLPTTAQGAQIILSGLPFESQVNSCFETSQPFNFLADAAASIKDQGTGSPQLWGIDPSPYTLNTRPYAPLLTMIDSFAPGNSYLTSNVSAWGWGTLETIAAQSGQLITDFSQFYGAGPVGGGTVNYTLGGTVTATATQSTPGGNTQTSSLISGFPSVVPAYGQSVSLTMTINGNASVSGFGVGNGVIIAQYSPDAGVTWYSFFNYSSGGSYTLSPITITSTIIVSNLAQVQVRAQAVAACSSPSVTVSASSTVSSVFATITDPQAFGPIANGMISVTTFAISTIARTAGVVTVVTATASGYAIGEIANISGVMDVSYNGTFTLTGATGTTLTFVQAGTTGSSTGGFATAGSINVPIASVAPTALVGGLYTQLLVTTQTAHGLIAGSLCSLYASSNDTVDGFYQVIAAPTTTTFTVPFITATGASAAALGYVMGGSPTPSACVLGDEYTNPYPTQISAYGFYQWVPPTTATFPVGAWAGTVASNTTGTIGQNVALDLSQNNEVTDDDLIVITLLVSVPQNIAQIELRFQASGANNYYTKFISPAYYQSAVNNSQLAYSATESQILAETLGLITGQAPNTTSSQLQPSNFSTGAGSWIACYMRRGDFLPVGQAGQPGLDWSNITGWELLVSTITTAGASFSVNGLYLQWGYGPSSIGGVGYDYRQTYYDDATGTESSPCPIQEFNIQYGYLSSAKAPIFLRQASQNTGQYSLDPQVSHVRMYRRGGTLSSNWIMIGQIPNITGIGQFTYKDVTPDALITQAKILELDNDPPVTSSLVSPIQTSLTTSAILLGQSSIYSTYAPQSLTVSQSGAVFVPNQIVVVGSSANLEQVRVITGGTGTFTAILRLEHNANEAINVYAVPRQACNQVAFAYNQMWLAGDPNNPHYLYYSKKGQPENFPPQNYIPVSTPDDPINAVIDWRGTLIVGTLKTWKIIVGGAEPYAQPTGSVHGIVAQGGWIEVEGSIWYRSNGGLRQFTGADGVYKTLPVEWVYQGNPLCIPPQADKTQRSQDILCYFNNQVFDSYKSTAEGNPRYRMIWSTEYQRFRYDDVAATAMLWEKDTGILLVGKKISTGNYAVMQDQVGDYDDGGWVSGSLVQTPINMVIQTPYHDIGKPHNKKQFNELESDVNTQGQVMTTTLLFENGATTLALSPITTSTRQKVELFVNAGLGQEAYRASIKHTIPVLVAPILYGEDLYAAVLAENSASVDSYWVEFGTKDSKFVKECVFDYTSAYPIYGSLYADNSTVPYFTFTLPAQSQRYVLRQRFGNVNNGTTAFTMRTWRMVLKLATDTSNQSFQCWAKPQTKWKPIGNHGYRVYEVDV